MRKAFTLIELMISIVILTILMLFLYKAYSSLNRSNLVYSKEVKKIIKATKIKKTIYLDFMLLSPNGVKILNQSKTEDIVFLQSSHSIYDRVEPYIAYIVNNKKLYRLESLQKFTEYPLPPDIEFTAEYIGKVKSFRVYINDKKAKTLKFLIACDFEDLSDVLLKIKALNAK